MATGERVLLVDDILTTGGSLLAMLPAVEATGRRHRRMRRPGRPEWREGDPDVADDRAGLSGPRPVAARPADLRAGAVDLPRCADGTSRSMRPAAPARHGDRPPAPERWIGPPRTSSCGSSPRSSWSPARSSCSRTRQFDADGRPRACRPTRPRSVGIIVAIDASSLTDVRSFTLRTTDGQRLTFGLAELQNGTQFAPGHLAEHQATAQPVRVFYRDDDGTLQALRLEDAHP